MAVDTHIYDKRFFDNTVKFEADSAKAVVQILNNCFKPNSVIDIGCGVGIYLKEFSELGTEILGYDGAPEAINNSLVGNKIKIHDLTKPLLLDRKFDLCLCVEVAEHLPKSSADTLVNSLIKLSDNLVFTAATPGQGPESIGHINEQPHDYWISKFEQKGFSFNKKLSEELSAAMREKKVVWWVTKNLMIFKKKGL